VNLPVGGAMVSRISTVSGVLTTPMSRPPTPRRLYRKGPGKEARLCFMGHALIENCNGLIVGAVITGASGHAERLAALALIEPHADRPQPVTLGADKGYDSSDFVMELRDEAVDLARCSEPERTPLGNRPPYHPPCRRRGLATHPRTH
jgi:hypothetical protein